MDETDAERAEELGVPITTRRRERGPLNALGSWRIRRG
ncbi:hypothetical protein MBT84_47995 [Streptomyces sp. MBT84]|nr:hypothetical protein [Streptomyces sp. MBT84]